MNYGTVVVFGNSTDSFARMAHVIDASTGFLPGPVFVQAGVDAACLRARSGCEVVDWVPQDVLKHNLASCRMVVCHAGVGIVKEALFAGLRPAVFVRVAALGEHIDNHQSEWMEVLRQRDLAVQVGDAEALRAYVGAGRFRNTDVEKRLKWLDDAELRNDLDCYIRSVISR